MAIRVTPTDADFEHACMRFFKKWSDIKAEARYQAAVRMIEERHRETGEIIARLHAEPKPGHAEWRKLNDRLDVLFAEGEELSRIAFPSTYKDATP